MPHTHTRSHKFMHLFTGKPERGHFPMHTLRKTYTNIWFKPKLEVWLKAERSVKSTFTAKFPRAVWLRSKKKKTIVHPDWEKIMKIETYFRLLWLVGTQAVCFQLWLLSSLRKCVVTSRGNILHVMDVIEEHCTLYKTAGSGFYLHEEKKNAAGKTKK